MSYEDDVSKPEVTESVVAKSSRFEGFDKPSTETAAKPSPVLLLPTEPKSKSSSKLQDQLESPDFKEYMESKKNC